MLRYSDLPDSDLVARRVAVLERVTCAAPDYLERFGEPEMIDDLGRHRLVGIRLLQHWQSHARRIPGLGRAPWVELSAPFSVTGAESYLLRVQYGLGLAQVPRFQVEAYVASGALIEVLATTPPTSAQVSLLYPRSRQLSPPVRVLLDWAAEALATRSGLSM